MKWHNGQPNVFANQPNDQHTYREGFRIHVRHDAIGNVWYAYGTGLVNESSSLYWPQTWETREAAKSFIDANYRAA
jgi:hypothetical protein